MAIDWTKVITVSDEDTVDVTCGKEVLYVRGGGSGGSGGPAIWGAIIGDIEDQDDLMDALDTKADVSAVEAKADKDIIAGEFSASTAYAIGDYVVYEGDLYRFTAAHSAGAWSGSDAVMITVSAELKTKLTDAPSDDKIYGRKNGAWTETATGYKKVTYYLDASNVQDPDMDGSSAHPFCRIWQLLQACPDRSNGEVMAYVAAGTYPETDAILIYDKKISFVAMSQGTITIDIPDQTFQGYDILNSIVLRNSELSFGGDPRAVLSLDKPIHVGMGSYLYTSMWIQIDMTGSRFAEAGIGVSGNSKLYIYANYSFTSDAGQGSAGVECSEISSAYADYLIVNAYTGIRAKKGSTVSYHQLSGTMTEQTHTEDGGRIYTGAQ